MAVQSTAELVKKKSCRVKAALTLARLTKRGSN